MNILIEYLKYKLKAKGRHGIHSPFVYSLVDKTLQKKISSEDKKIIHDYINSLKNNHSVIKITDFGAGSKKLGKERKIAEIYKNASAKKKYGRLLYQLSRDLKPHKILELGTSLGVGTMHLHLGNSNSEITTIEGCPATFKFTGEQYFFKSEDKIQTIESKFQDFLEGDESKYDLIYIDGHHDGEATLNYLELLANNSHDETIYILDDIRWSDDMFEMWNGLVDNTRYHLTIDFFRMGIISKRSHQQKEHFILKK